MSLLDELKGKAEELKDKTGDLAGDGAEKLRGTVESIGDFVDGKTDGKYSEKVQNLKEAANDLLNKVGNDETPPSA